MSRTAAPARTTAADAILRLMEQYGLDTIFSIPGVHTVDFYRSLPERRIRHVTPRHEQGAAFMAYGYAFATGRPACCMLITGPGVLNAATGIAEAYSDSVPMFVIAANNLRAELGVGRGALHETKSQSAVQEQIASFTHTLLDVGNLTEVFHRAMSVMQVGRPRPAILEVPRDLLAAATDMPANVVPEIHRPAPDPEGIRKAAALLAGARAPLIIAGGGARGAAPEIRALAERLAIPVVTTNSGKGILAETHPLSLGSSLPFVAMQEVIAAADVVLALGTELGETDLLYTGKAYRIEGKLIRIDIESRQLTMNYLPALALLSDAAAAVRALLAEQIAPAAASLQDERHALVAGLKARLTEGWSADSPQHKAVLSALSATLAPDALICADSTQLAYTGNHFFPSPQPGGWLFPNGYGTLGSAMPAAIGAKIGCPDRQVLAIVGDGSFLYSIEELTTAVENRLGLPIILWNNRAYGEIRDAMVAADIPTIGVDLYTPHFTAIAKGFGCRALKAQSLEELTEEVKLSFARPHPTLIQIDTDGSLFAKLGQ